MMGSFALLDLPSQALAVEQLLSGRTEEEKLAWLGARGSVTPILPVTSGTRPRYLFESAIGLRCVFFVDRDKLVFIGDNTAYTVRAMYQTKLRYTEPLLREAVRAFVIRAVIRQLGVRFFLVVALLVAITAYLIHHRDPGWMVGFLVATVLFVATLVAAIYVAHLRGTIGRFRRMGTPEATFGYDERRFSFTSELGTVAMPWSAVTEVWRHPRFWLLLFSRSQFITLPLDCLDEQARAFITRMTS